MGDPQVTMVVSILKWCNDLNDLGPHFRKPPLDDITLTTGCWRFFWANMGFHTYLIQRKIRVWLPAQAANPRVSLWKLPKHGYASLKKTSYGGFQSHGVTLIAGWFISWKIPSINGWELGVPSGKHTKNYRKSPFFKGKSTISMAIFNSYVSHYQRVALFQETCINQQG